MNKPKVVQFIPLDDQSGMLKNISELLQEIRDGNIDSLFLGYSRKDDSMRTFWSGNLTRMAEFFLLAAQMKFDYLSNRFSDYFATSYGDEEDGD